MNQVSDSKVYLVKGVVSSLGKETLEEIVPILERKSYMSLRLIEYFVMKYSRRHHSCAMVEQNGVRRFSFFYAEYKSFLLSYPKKLFDPFRRNDNSLALDFNGRQVQTSIGQLNFFKWAVHHGVLDYIREHLQHIQDEMKRDRNMKKKKDSVTSIFGASSSDLDISP